MAKQLKAPRETYTDDNGLIRYKDTNSVVGTGGRPVGAKNKTTLVKEAIQNGMEDTLLQYGLKVLQATAQAAVGHHAKDKDGNLMYDEFGNPLWVDGDNICKKLLLDRMAPVVRSESGGGDGKFEITINVQGMEAKIGQVDTVDADYEEM